VNNTIRHLLDEIHALEDKLRTELHEQESRLTYQIHGKRVEFEQTIRDAHTRLKVGFLRWIIADRPQNLLCAPFIYGMIIPLALLDLCLTLYQAICFPIFRIAKARRAHYLVFDRHKLEYLNVVEKFHCLYCEYANGLAAYATEIIALTEQYFCPIRHARKVLGSHERYTRFLDYGEAADYHEKLESYRNALELKPADAQPQK
jgi:hypothetical protein